MRINLEIVWFEFLDILLKVSMADGCIDGAGFEDYSWICNYRSRPVKESIIMSTAK